MWVSMAKPLQVQGHTQIGKVQETNIIISERTKMGYGVLTEVAVTNYNVNRLSFELVVVVYIISHIPNIVRNPSYIKII